MGENKNQEFLRVCGASMLAWEMPLVCTTSNICQQEFECPLFGMLLLELSLPSLLGHCANCMFHDCSNNPQAWVQKSFRAGLFMFLILPECESAFCHSCHMWAPSEVHTIFPVRKERLPRIHTPSQTLSHVSDHLF